MNTEREYCPVHEAIQVLQEKWTMHIVRALLDGPLGFNELGRAVGGCNPATLEGPPRPPRGARHPQAHRPLPDATAHVV